ncbi:MAG: glutamine--fructose-6-phosphate transaminase (isomerizing) [Christensenellaceae bacterium]|nr:glutamine--fructose-6-phosphate transaminase (isomerizing) [Christensenellaceae bacterium]
MCGIVGYVGSKNATPILLDALEKLEYRGYDSAGIALVSSNGIEVKKTRGRISTLRSITGEVEAGGCTVGIGHTRWATHGEPSDVNSHPHLSRSERVAVVHNGIIENYIELREFLAEHGYVFSTETDSEVVSELIDYYYNGDPIEAVRKAEMQLKGSYALGILFKDYTDQIIALRKDGPLIIGVGEGENFIASDIPAILKHTRSIFRLGERELAILTKDGVTVIDKYGERIEHECEHIDWDVDAAEKGGYAHFMIKEIMEQPEVIAKTINPRIINDKRIDLGLKRITDDDLRGIKAIKIVACGSAYHVGVVAKYFMKKTLGIPVEAELASEFRYDDPIVDEHTLVIIISQSGETLDTLYGLREARSRGARVISIVNVVASSIANESEDVLYTWAGPEIAVATTKAYSTQLVLMNLLNWHIANVKGLMRDDEVARAITQLREIPEQMNGMLSDHEQMQYLASLFFNCHSVFFIGRNIDYALSLEASLKLKEISYVHSEAYAAGELKHGTISLIEDGTLVIALCTYRPLLEKMVSNIKEVKARGAKVIAIINHDDTQTEGVADHVVRIPECSEYAIPSLTIVPLQLFAYYIASHKGCDIDKPRNLAKSVTVE